MQFYSLFATVAIYVVLISQAIHAYPVPARFESTDIQTRDVLEPQFADLSVRYSQPILGEEIVSRDWKSQAKKLFSWKKKNAATQPVHIMVKTEVMQHHDSLPHQHVEHPHIPKVDGKYHRVQMNGGGPRPQKQHIGMAITTDEPAIAKPVPVKSFKPLPPLPHGGA
jgi:hypothetical protein